MNSATRCCEGLSENLSEEAEKEGSKKGGERRNIGAEIFCWPNDSFYDIMQLQLMGL